MSTISQLDFHMARLLGCFSEETSNSGARNELMNCHLPLPIGELQQSHAVLPPPSPEENTSPEFIPGEFLYVENGRDYLQDAYRVISMNEWWTPFTQYLQTTPLSNNTGFTFTIDPFYSKIMSAIASTPIGAGHSGYSIGFCMRVMQQIALHGEAEYRRKYLLQRTVS